MSRDLIDKAHACIQRVDHGAGQPLTLDEAVQQVQHPLAGVKPDDLRTIVAYLCCQHVGLAQSRDANAGLAMQQIARIVAGYADRQPHTLQPAEAESVGQLALGEAS